MDEYDAIVVGGSFAGLSAALYLARARRTVLVLDSGAPRNRFAAHSHGVFALDGRPGSELLRTARAQLEAYPTAHRIDTTVRRASKVEGTMRFEVETEDRRRFLGRRLVLATGLVDVLPDVPGLEPRWGTSVFHCPYCDGYEHAGGPLGVLATLPLSIHFAKIVAEWGPTTLFTNGAVTVEATERAELTRRSISVEDRKVVALQGSPPDRLEAVELEDGHLVATRALFVATYYRQAAPLATELGCAMEENPRGRLVRTDEGKMTTVPGVYAAGDLARPTHSIPFATSDGVTAGVSAHQSLVSA